MIHVTSLFASSYLHDVVLKPFRNVHIIKAVVSKVVPKIPRIRSKCF